MPQPLSKLIKRNQRISIRAGLPMNKPALCAHAMNVISLWSLIDRDTAAIVISLVPGKASPVAELFNDSRADSPKRAIRNALAASMLEGEELATFEGLMRRYDTAYKLRNPLAHWTLAQSPDLPDVIIAIDPAVYLKISADNEPIIDRVWFDISSPSNAHLKPGQRFSDQTRKALEEVYQKNIAQMSAYRLGDLEAIEKQLNELLRMLHEFRTAVRLRFLKIDHKVRPATLLKLAQKLGLSLPKAG